MKEIEEIICCPISNDYDKNKSLLDEIKEEFKLLTKEKKIQYITLITKQK